MREGSHVSAITAAGGESLLAHGIHYGLVGGGVVGLGLLLLPQLLDRSGSRPRSSDRTELDRRITALRAQVADGSLLTAAPSRPAYTPTGPPRTLPQGAPVVSTLLLPLAVVSMLAAAGVHAAVGPAHFSEGLPLGLFFAGSSALQLAWCVTVLRRPTTRLLEAGIAGNLAIVSLWATTRTLGLPGLLPGPEPVGRWDLACSGWELVTVAACALALLAGGPGRTPGWAGWHATARAWLVLSLAGLVGLAATGAPA